MKEFRPWQWALIAAALSLLLSVARHEKKPETERIRADSAVTVVADTVQAQEEEEK
jgi:hypothetical protein